MNRFSKRLIAILWAVWLPLFSGNALAMAIPMQTMDDHCLVAMQAHAGNHESPGHQPLQHQQPSQKDCGICQLACCTYLAAVTVAIADIPSAAQSFAPSSTQFQSFTSAPLDPPPLARA